LLIKNKKILCTHSTTVIPAIRKKKYYYCDRFRGNFATVVCRLSLNILKHSRRSLARVKIIRQYWHEIAERIRTRVSRASCNFASKILHFALPWEF